MIVLSTGHGVNGFMLDPSIGEFVLTDANMMCKPRGKIYSINEGYEEKWDPAIKEYVKSKKQGKAYGGRYIDPATADNPNGKLRVLYECMPMAFLLEQAGGMASTGEKPVLDIVPRKLHERSPIYLGSKDDVEDLLEVIAKHKAA